MTRKQVLLLLVLITAYLWGNYILAKQLIQTKPADFEENIVVQGHQANTIDLTTKDSLKIKVWHFEHYSDQVVILLAGRGGNRTQMLSRAKLYLKQGYNILIPDLRGSGKSGGDYVSFGWHERFDLKAVYTFAKALGFEKIGVHGISLGAATICYGVEQELKYDFAILESCYNNIDQAFSNRMWNLYLPPFIFYPTKLFIEWKLDLDRVDLYPENWVKQLTCPTLLMCGDQEVQLKLEESEKLFQNIAAKEKAIYLFNGAKHEDLLHYATQDYLTHWGHFIKMH